MEAVSFTPISLFATVKGYIKIRMYEEAISLLEKLIRKGCVKANYLLALLNFFIFLNPDDCILSPREHLVNAVERARAYTDHFPDCGEGFFFLGHLLIIMLFYCEEKSKREELILNSQICLNRANQLLKGKGWQVMQALQDIAAISKEPLETLSGNDKNYMHYRSVDNLIEFCFLKLLT